MLRSTGFGGIMDSFEQEIYSSEGYEFMVLPKYDEFYRPLLICLSDMQPHKMREVISFCADYFSLSDSERNASTTSGASVLATRVSWART